MSAVQGAEVEQSSSDASPSSLASTESNASPTYTNAANIFSQDSESPETGRRRNGGERTSCRRQLVIGAPFSWAVSERAASATSFDHWWSEAGEVRPLLLLKQLDETLVHLLVRNTGLLEHQTHELAAAFKRPVVQRPLVARARHVYNHARFDCWKTESYPELTLRRLVIELLFKDSWRG